MAYTKTTWANNSAPYLDATNLNKIEVGIEEAHTLAEQATQNAENTINDFVSSFSGLEKLADVIIQDGWNRREGYKIMLDAPAQNVQVDIYARQTDWAGYSEFYTYFDANQLPTRHFQYNPAQYAGETLNVTLQDYYDTDYDSSGRRFMMHIIPSSGDWQYALTEGVCFATSDNGSFRVGSAFGQYDNAWISASLGDFGVESGLTPIRSNEQTYTSGLLDDSPSFYEFKNSNFLSTLTKGDVVFALHSQYSYNTYFTLTPVVVGGVDTVNHRLYTAYGASCELARYGMSERLYFTKKAVKLNSVADSLGQAFYDGAGSWSLTSSDGRPWVGGMIVFRDSTGGEYGAMLYESPDGESILLTANGFPAHLTNQQLQRDYYNEGSWVNPFNLTESFYEFDIYLWYDPRLGQAPSDGISFTVPAGEWGAAGQWYYMNNSNSPYSGRPRANTLAYDGTSEADGYYTYIWSANNVGSPWIWPNYSSMGTLNDFRAARTRSGDKLMFKGFDQVDHLALYSFDGTTFYSSREDPVNENQSNDSQTFIRRPYLKYEGGMWWRNTSQAGFYGEGSSQAEREQFRTAYESAVWQAMPQYTDFYKQIGQAANEASDTGSWPYYLYDDARIIVTDQYGVPQEVKFIWYPNPDQEESNPYYIEAGYDGWCRIRGGDPMRIYVSDDGTHVVVAQNESDRVGPWRIIVYGERTV